MSISFIEDTKKGPTATLVIVRGLPMSGKTELAKSFPGFLHVENAMFLAPGPATKEAIIAAEQRCLAAVVDALKEGLNIAVSNCFGRVEYMFPFIQVVHDLVDSGHNVGVRIFETKKTFRGTPDFSADEMDIYRKEFQTLMSLLGAPATQHQRQGRDEAMRRPKTARGKA